MLWDKGARFAVQKLFLSAVAVCCLLPAAFLIWNALQTDHALSLGQFEEVLLYDWPFYVWLWNSVRYAAAILAIQIPVSIFAAYGFSRFDFPGRRPLFFLYMLLMLLPFQATVMPQYMILNTLRLLDTRWAVILPNAFGAFGTFLLTQFMKGIDPELLQAARLDGAGDLGVLWYVILPLCRPAIAVLAILQLIGSWSLIDQPLLFLRSEALLPLSLELGSQAFGAAAFAAGLIFAAPPVLVCLCFRKALENGARRGHSQGMKMGAGNLLRKLSAGAFLTLLLLTWVSWKLDSLRTPQVVCVTPTSGRMADAQGAVQSYSCVLPLDALYGEGKQRTVYLVENTNSFFSPLAARKASVAIEAQTEREAAVAGLPSGNVQIVLYASRALSGETVPVMLWEEGMG